MNHTENFTDSLSDNSLMISPKKIKIKKEKIALRKFQLKELLENASKNTKHLMMIKTQLGLGIRVNELVNLTIPQINFKSMEVRIESRNTNTYAKSFSTKTESSNRTILIDKTLAKELKLFLAGRKTGYVFLSQKTKKPFFKCNVIAFINKYAKQSPSIARNIGSHSLRRTYASSLIEDGVSIGTLSDFLGHASIRTTMIYLKSIKCIDTKQVNKALKSLIPKINVEKKI
jgi:integrase